MVSRKQERRSKHDPSTEEPTSSDPGNAHVLQKRQFLAQIAQRTGLRNTEIKPVVEATLAELGDAIAAGKTLALPPLGRARINRQTDASGSEVIVLRLRRRKAAESGNEDDAQGADE
ncbi:HU family DNA-binding protein [Paracoccus sp. MBLB3053]|uniref:HU family DNA-binding protein n=1 Tax=Paracoccus aurantius TaxID=3073814 RepID=A0ABU2HTY0_9RHOB|nr:HU family DNA-binding protein [Paracoccus sp. MBLB3053]MDS9468501.1 HU family DNA-binding protein [Paracoccus sp. MBLB3053]